MRKLGAALVDVNAQNSSLSLRAPATQLALLDMIAGTAPLARAFGDSLRTFQAVRRRLDEMQCALARSACWVCSSVIHTVSLSIITPQQRAQPQLVISLQCCQELLQRWLATLAGLYALAACNDSKSARTRHASSLPSARPCRYLEDDEARQADEELVARIVGMQLTPGSVAELEAAVRGFEGRAQSVQDSAQAHEALGSGAALFRVRRTHACVQPATLLRAQSTDCTARTAPMYAESDTGMRVSQKR